MKKERFFETIGKVYCIAWLIMAIGYIIAMIEIFTSAFTKLGKRIKKFFKRKDKNIFEMYTSDLNNKDD